MKGYYFITDASLSAAGLISDIENAIAADVDVIQYRNKTAVTRVLYYEAQLVKNICAGTRTRLIINDRIDVALAIGADGVHIGHEDMPYKEARQLLGSGRMIGVTVHNLAEALDAQRCGADYLGVSPIFATGTKPDAGLPCGVGLLAEIRHECTIPLVAIGGIGLDNVDSVISAGADMVCAISAVLTRPDVNSEILKFQRKFGL